MLISRLTPSWRASRVGWLLGTSRGTASILDKIAETGEVAAIPYLRDYTISNNRAVREAALAAVHNLVLGLRPRDYVWLDRHMRDSWLMSYQWNEALKPNQLETAAASSRFRSAFLGVASTHASGYVRQAAVALLGDKVADGSELPFLLVRCNDWVEQVRVAANVAVQDRLSPENATHFVRNYWLIKWLESCRRSSQSELVRQINDFLIKPHAHAELVAQLDSPDSSVRRGCFDLMLAGGVESVAALVKRVRTSPDSVLRQKALSAASGTLQRDELKKILLGFTDDPSVAVRRSAFVCLTERFPELPMPALEKAILDRHASLRDVARTYVLRRQPDRDVRAEYIAELKSAAGWRLTAALGGIGECGLPSDADLLLPFFESGLARDRRTILRGLKRLDFGKWISTIIAAIADPRPSVSRTARVLLRRSVPGDRIDEVHGLLEKIVHRHGMCNLLSLIAEQHTWRTASALLSACSHVDQVVAERAYELFRIWVSVPFLPSGSQMEVGEVRDLLRSEQLQLSKKVVESLGLMLRLATD